MTETTIALICFCVLTVPVLFVAAWIIHHLVVLKMEERENKKAMLFFDEIEKKLGERIERHIEREMERNKKR
jgi:hypothetical protein